MNQLAISTCLVSRNAQHENAAYLLDRLAEVGLARLELEYRLTPAQLRELIPLTRSREITVTSLHNFCPPPPGIPSKDFSGDIFNLSSQDPEERKRAVRFTEATLEFASDLEAQAVVVHLGKVKIKSEREVIKQACQQNGITPALASQLEARSQIEAKALDAASFSLERLLERARNLGVILGLENRYHAYQVPSLEQTGILLKRFAGAPAAPWFDVGHAYVQQCAGLARVDDWLETFEGQFLGCHLHDVQEGYKDHQSPGQGDVDWPMLTKALAAVPLKVLELHPGPDMAEVREGAEMLAALFGKAQAENQSAQKEAAS